MKLGVRACFLLALLPGSAAWRAGAPQPRSSLLATARRRAVPLLCDSGSESLDQAGLFASLRARQQTLEDELSERWREAKCASKVPIALTDSWVRRVAVSWPQVAIGTADGSVVLADLSTGEELSRGRGPHPAHVEGPESARDMKLLHGDYDGGGLTALAFTAEHVVSAGREGGCVLWRIRSDGQLVQVAALRDGGEEQPPVVSSLVLVLTHAADGSDGGGDVGGGGGGGGGEGAAEGCLTVWAGCLDGSVRRWDVSDGTWTQRAAGTDVHLRVPSGSPVLDIAV